MQRKNLFGIALLTLTLLAAQATWALAGTTGGLNGRVVLQDGTTPVAGAKVSVASPSGTATATTDSNGAFGFISLIPDTYTVTATKDGYDTASQPGITVFADNTQNVVLKTQRSKTLGPPIVVRGSVDLVKPGTTSDVYSVNAATSAKMADLGGGANANNAYSAIASIPGLYTPPGQQGWYQSIYIRGGDYDQVGYEVDGVPVNRAFDNYPSSTASSLGQQELQLYTGAAPANAESQGLAGFINQVIKVGTYPGFASIDTGIGIGNYYNKFNFEAGGATQSRNFSYYLGLGGYKIATHVINQSNGADVSGLWGSPFDVAGCAPYAFTNRSGAGWPTDGNGNNSVPGGTDPTKADCYQATQNFQNNSLGGPGIFNMGPGGYILGSIANNGFTFSSTTDYETVLNLHFGLPHVRDGGKDDLQLLYTSSLLKAPYFGSPNDWGAQLFDLAAKNGDSQTLSGGNVPWRPCGNTSVPQAPGCGNPSGFPLLNAGFQYNGGPAGQLIASCVAPCGVIRYGFPSSGTTAGTFPCGGSTDCRFPMTPNVQPGERDTSENGQGIYKLQYQHNIGSTSYIRVYGYSYYSWWFLHGPNSLNTAFVGCCPVDYELTTHTRGASIQYANQLSAKHLINVGLSGVTASTVRDNNTQTLTNLSGSRRRFAVEVDANNPYSGICYTSSGTAASCEPDSVNDGGRANYRAYFQAISGGLPALTSNCGNPAGGGTNPCSWLIAETGPYATYNTVKPTFSAFDVTDQWKPNDKLAFNLGIRVDNFSYKGADTNRGNISTFWFNAWNNNHCISAIPGSSPIDQHEAIGLPIGTPCNTIPDPTNPGHNYLPATITNEGAPTLSYNVVQPRIGGTYTFDPNTVVRFSFGKYTQAPNAAFEQYNTLQNNLPAFLGARFAAYGFSSPAHHVGPSQSYNYDVSLEHQFRGDTSMKLTPFYRKTKDQYQTFFLDQKTSFVSGLPIGAETSEGVEFQLNKGSFQRNGFAGQLSYTYTWAYDTYQKLTNGGTVLSSVNNAIRTYNGYTSFCASNPSDPRCGLPTNLTTAAPCYTPSDPIATIDPAPTACAPGMVANPYWNAPVQPLVDAGGQFKPFSIFPNGFNSSVNSYLVPNIGTLILNWKHDKWSFTPTFQYIGNGFYGAPLQSVGIDPVANQIPGNNFFVNNPGEGGCNSVLGPAPTSANPSDPQYPYGAAGGNRYDAVTCGGGILIPNPYTGHFDSVGEFRSPAQFIGNLQITYEATPKVTYVLGMANIINTCFGGTTKPWTKYADHRVCNYGLPGYAPINFRGNFTNPGVADQPIVQFPYQQYFGTQPFGASLNVNIKL